MQVAEIWRYPVKSVRGEQLSEAVIGPYGIEFDRAWGIRDLSTGKILTARREPQLLFASASVDDDGQVAITLPDGSVTAENAALSSWLDRDVELARVSADEQGSYEIQLDFETEVGDWIEWQGPSGSFHDSTKTRVSLVSKSTMRSWDPERFRINVILDGDDEESLVGGKVTVGHAELDVLKEIDRCIVVTRPQADGIDRDLDVLRTINKERNGNLGIGANVITPGSITLGDPVTQ